MLVLNILTSFNLVVMFCLLFFRRDNAPPNRILGLILIDPAINFLSNVNILSGSFYTFPYPYFFAQVTSFAFGPMVHFYLRIMMGKPVNYRYPLYFVSLAGMLLTVFFGFQFSQLPEPEQTVYLDGLLHEPYPDAMVVANLLFILLQQIYFTISAIEVYLYRKKLANTLSDYSSTRVQYVRAFIWLIWALNFVTIILYATLPTTYVEYIYLPLVLTVIYSFILYFSFHYHSIFTGRSYESFVETQRSEAPPEETIPSEVKASGGELAGMMTDVESYLARTQRFTEPDLTLALIAADMNVSARKLSLAINTVGGKNFYDYIHAKRIEKSQELLIKFPHYTVEAIAQESGFQSRSTFYRAFKKHTGQTPADFVKDPSRS